MSTFDRQQFEAQARAAAPPMPADMRRAPDDLWDRTWFQWVFWPAVIIGVSLIGTLIGAMS